MPWQPTQIRRPDEALKTATDTVRVGTDAGPGYLKALGNHGGPHLLAAELVGTYLAGWFDLPIFDFAIVNVTDEDEITFLNGQRAQPGPAFVSRAESGMTWGGTAEELQLLVNPEDIGRLVVFDTWTRNCDRHPPDLAMRKPNRGNVFFSNEEMPDGQFRLIAMDHTHCFRCGDYLTPVLDHIDLVKDERIYGLFPEFKPFVKAHWATVEAAAAKLLTIDREWVLGVVAQIPLQWQVSPEGRAALANQIVNRATYVAETIGPSLQATLN
jgi:hypothetical protein